MYNCADQNANQMVMRLLTVMVEKRALGKMMQFFDLLASIRVVVVP